jgi:hypothetical protein
MSATSSIAILLETLDQVYSRHGWHGSTLRGSLRGVTPAQALWRPARGRHNIWELMLHAAYWKYIVRRRLTGVEESGGFPRKPSNWPAVPPSPAPKAWKADLGVLESEHRQLMAAVAALPPELLGRLSPKRKWTYAEEIHGVAAHDAYHCGQIQLIRRLWAG